jgi:FeS assembly protein SufD
LSLKGQWVKEIDTMKNVNLISRLVKKSQKRWKREFEKEECGNFVIKGGTANKTGFWVYSDTNLRIKEPVYIPIKADQKTAEHINNNVIIAQEGSELTVVLDYLPKVEGGGVFEGKTRVYAKENSVINLIKIQRFADNAKNIESTVVFLGEYAKLNLISVELGSNTTNSSTIVNLIGNGSEAEVSTIYLIDKKRSMDLSYTFNHRGIGSRSSLEGRGALQNEGRKIFRGNIKFKQGAKKARGCETENVLLLDPLVKSETIPAIYCHEDDVQGQHAASAGRINENQLFYLMSRGMSEKEAKRMLVEASFQFVLEKIPLDSLRKIISEEVERRINDV